MGFTNDYDMDLIDPLEFWSHVNVRDSIERCWLWKDKTEAGYGKYALGRANTSGKPHQFARAHRVAWEIKYDKPFPKGKVARHRCDNKRCCNPFHILPGTNEDNLRDAVIRGQIKRGAESPAARNPQSMGYVGKRAEYYFKKYGRTEPLAATAARRGTWTPRLRKGRMTGEHRDGEVSLPEETLAAYEATNQGAGTPLVAKPQKKPAARRDVAGTDVPEEAI